MALGEIGISKTLRSSKTGFLFFLLLQTSLLSKVSSTGSTTDAPSTTLTSASTAVTVTQSVSTQSTIPESSSSSTSADQTSTMATSASSTTATTPSNTESTSSVSIKDSSMSSTNMNTVSQTSSSPSSSSSSSSSSVTGNYSRVSCPEFTCTADYCYIKYMNVTLTACPPNYICEIMKQNTSYSVSCSASCGMSCGNMTQSNCSWNCCNTTNCLNETLLALTNSLSTTAATTSTTTTTTTKAPVTSTQANNGKKCHSLKCDGAMCYKTTVSSHMMCPVGQDYCMLKKTTSGTTESWQGGCSEDCRKMAVCSTTVTTCYLECCNATASSCLKLTGEVNMPSSATRGLHSPALLVASLLLFWIVRVFT